MKKFLQQNWFKLVVLVIILVLIGGAFYWYEWRPTKIKKDCSWVQKHSDTDIGLSKEDAKIEKEKCIEEANKNREYGTWGDLNYNSKIDVCNSLWQSTPQPAKNWYEPASEKEYEYCLRKNGLKK